MKIQCAVTGLTAALRPPPATQPVSLGFPTLWLSGPVSRVGFNICGKSSIPPPQALGKFCRKGAA